VRGLSGSVLLLGGEWKAYDNKKYISANRENRFTHCEWKVLKEGEREKEREREDIEDERG